MPHTLMKQLSELKLTGMATALSAQMEQPGHTKTSRSKNGWPCWSPVNRWSGTSVSKNCCCRKRG